MSGIFGGIGRLEIQPLGTWLDITTFWRAEGTPLTITRGRQTELDSVQSSQLTAVLDNTDGRFTPGYTAGPYGAGFTAGCPVRYSETIGERTFTLFTGYVEFPDVDSWQPIGYQETQLSATDLLTRLARTTPFVSTLGAHIVYNGGTSLISYYPMNDPAAPFLDALSYGPPMTATVETASLSVNPTGVTGAAAISPASTAMAAGDDLSALSMTMQTATLISSTVGTLASFSVGADFEAAGKAITIASGQSLTVVAWFNADPSSGTINIAEVLTAWINSAPGVFFDLIELRYDASGTTNSGDWYSSHFVGSGPTFIAGKAVINHWVPIALRYSWSPQTVELWFADQPVQSGAWTGSPPGALTLAQFYAASVSYAGAVAHVQIYVGDPNAYTHAMFLAQMQMGLTGMEYQTTGQRVTTILNYAGVPAGLQSVDPGRSFMSKATLSGQTAAQALQTAVDTERGRAFISGDGRYVFQDRAHTLNV